MTTPPEPSDESDYDRAACGLLTTSADGTILRVNDTMCTWLGRGRDDLVGKRFQDLLTVGSKLFHHTHWMPLLQMQGSVAEVQLEMVDAREQVMPILVNAVRRGGAEGAKSAEVDIAVFVAKDRRQYERELLLARRRAEELLERERAAQEARAAAEEALRVREQEARERATFAEQLIGIVSHDLRNPLNAVILGSHLLAERSDNAEVGKMTNKISTAAHRANRMIEDLLDFTQARLRGGLRVHPRTFDLHDLCRDCIDELRLAWPGRSIDHHEAGAAKAIGDPDRLAQVVTNLVGNALTYGARDTPVEVFSTVNESTMQIEVRNGGEPIAPGVIDAIFEPMVRADVRGARNRSVGLGLYIVREIARAHGGDVVVRSRAEEGTSFIVTLPTAEQKPATP